MKIYVSTCDKYDKLLTGFAYLFNKYWPGQDVTVLGFRQPAPLPANFTFHSMAQAETEPWSTYMNRVFTAITEKRFVFLFDDYWLREPVNQERVAWMERVVTHNAAKGDLSGNTHYFPHTTYKNNPELVVASQNAPYRTSTQPAIWRKEYMCRLMQPGWNPWQFELNAPAGNDGYTIVGPRTPIYIYANAYYKGSPDPYMLAKLSDDDLIQLEQIGALQDMPKLEGLKGLRSQA